MAENLKRIIWLKWLITVTTAGSTATCLTPGCQRKALQDIRNAALYFATIAYDPDPDLTPLTVRRLCKALFGRTGSQWLVVEVLGRRASAPQRGQQSEMVEKWLPDIVMPPNYTGPQRWQKLNG